MEKQQQSTISLMDVKLSHNALTQCLYAVSISLSSQRVNTSMISTTKPMSRQRETESYCKRGIFVISFFGLGHVSLMILFGRKKQSMSASKGPRRFQRSTDILMTCR